MQAVPFVFWLRHELPLQYWYELQVHWSAMHDNESVESQYAVVTHAEPYPRTDT